MTYITLNGIDLDGDDIDYATDEGDGEYMVALTDSGSLKADAAELYVYEDDLDATDFERLLDIIQPT